MNLRKNDTRATAFLFCLIVLLTSTGLRAEKPTTTVTGVVKRFEVDRGNVRSVYIEDPREGDLLVVRSTEIGKELLKRVGATVRATGYLRKSREPQFEQVIDVLRYEVVLPDELAPEVVATPRKDE